MWTSAHWITATLRGRLGIMPRPRGGDWLRDEIQGWKRDGISLVISLLEKDETEELELAEEQSLCREAKIEFLSLPIADRGVPASVEAATEVVRIAYEQVLKGRAVVIHCRAGIGRSSLIAGCVLVLAGDTADRAIERIGDARGLRVPDTDAQLDWLRQFAGRCHTR